MERNTNKTDGTKPERKGSLPSEMTGRRRRGLRQKRGAPDYFALFTADKREPPARDERFVLTRVPIIVKQQAEHVSNAAKRKKGNLIRFAIEHGTPIVKDLPGVMDLRVVRARLLASGSIDDAGWLDLAWLTIPDLHGDPQIIWARTAPGETTDCAVLAQELGLHVSPIGTLALIAVLAQMSVVASPARRYLQELFIDAAHRIKARARRAQALAALPSREQRAGRRLGRGHAAGGRVSGPYKYVLDGGPVHLSILPCATSGHMRRTQTALQIRPPADAGHMDNESLSRCPAAQKDNPYGDSLRTTGRRDALSGGEGGAGG